MRDYIPMEPYGYDNRKNREKRESVDALLKEHPDWSDGRIAQACNVGDTLVLRRRRILVEQKAIPASTQRLTERGRAVDINLQGVVVYDPTYTYGIRKKDDAYVFFVIQGKQRHDIVRLTPDVNVKWIVSQPLLQN